MNAHPLRRWALPSALLLATLLVVVLALQNRGLRADYAELLRRTRLPHPGLPLPTFETRTLSGASVIIGRTAPGARQLLFIFNTTCPYCQASLPAWQTIAATLDTLTDAEVRAYGISLDPVNATRAYASRHRLAFPVLTFPEPKLQALYRTGRVPQVLLLDNQGRVLYARPGVLEAGAAIDSVLAAVRAEATRPADRPRVDPPAFLSPQP